MLRHGFSAARYLGVATAIAVCTTAVIADEPADPAGFVPLFNGKNLSGWEAGGNDKLWKVENGMIVGDSPGIEHNQFLATTKSYGDFELRLEFRLKDGIGNSGVQFRSQRVPKSDEVSGYQADIGEENWGNLYDESRRRKWLVKAAPEVRKSIRREGWNDYKIRAVGKRVLLVLNGVTTADYEETEADIPQEGIIALQVHNGPKLRVEFRNIRIREIKKGT